MLKKEEEGRRGSEGEGLEAAGWGSTAGIKAGMHEGSAILSPDTRIIPHSLSKCLQILFLFQI